MNDHSRLLILGGVVVVLAPFVLIGIGIASDYRAAHPNRPYEPHHARNIVLGFAVVTMASVVFARLSHHPQAPMLAPVRTESATGVPFVPVPTSVVAAAPRAVSPGASAATSPRSTTTTWAVPGSGLITAFLSALVKGTTVTTAPTVPHGTVVVTTTKPPTTTATTKSTVATTTTTRGATTTTRTTLPRSTTTTTRPLPTTTTVATTTTTVPATTTTVPATTTTACLQQRQQPRRCR